ncbi:MAG TPA: endo-1,4-beta-xylanase [Gemmatimonadaceae bacterium]
MKSRFLAALVMTGVLSTSAIAQQQQPKSLKEAFASSFMIGAALNADQFSGTDVAGAALVKAQFNTITPENVLKWEEIHPQPTTYNFGPADRYVAFGEANKMFVVGHTLVWHSQTPRWVFQDADGKPLTRDALLARMREHIFTVVGRYKGRIKGWDVVNEALNEDGTLRKSPWFNIVGEDYIAQAFKFAHEADPAAELYYNDYNLEVPAKRDGAVALVKRLKAQGVTIHAVGSQAHDKIDLPRSAALHDSSITALAAAGVKVNITELDVDVLPRVTQNRTADVSLSVQQQAAANPFAAGLPDSVQQKLTKRYVDLFTVFLKHRDVIDRVTLWGVGDGDSWLNNWPMRGRTNYPLLFDRRDMPKPAYDAILRLIRPGPAA